MGSSPSLEVSRARRGISRHRGIRAATPLVWAVGRICWLLAAVPGRWLRLRSALASLGAVVAEHFALGAPPASLGRPLLARA
ncbi:MAG TPA: hypothetical protein VFA46_12940, partial [Actinomycetes bacterium]|nr:hypothetical protein [Actinomycetes bacterium]